MPVPRMAEPVRSGRARRAPRRRALCRNPRRRREEEFLIKKVLVWLVAGFALYSVIATPDTAAAA